MTCVLVAGEIASGKTSFALRLAEVRNSELVRVRDALIAILNLPSDSDRRTLQVEGAALDRRTRGRWLAEFLIQRADTSGELVVDALRTEQQCLPILEQVPGAKLVYLAASSEVRRRRYEQAARSDAVKASSSFDEAMNHETERQVLRLRSIADIVVETDDMPLATIVSEVSSRLDPPKTL